MKHVLLASLILLAGCGFSQKNGDLIGQAKKVSSRTNLVCPDYNMVDISLGVMRNGVGSMSTQDMWLQIDNDRDYNLLKDAASKGLLVQVTYDTRRMPFCTEEYILTSAKILEAQ